MEDKKNNKEILGKFHIISEAVPIAQRTRQLPYYIQKPLKKWLDLGRMVGIFQKYEKMNQLQGVLH